MKTSVEALVMFSTFTEQLEATNSYCNTKRFIAIPPAPFSVRLTIWIHIPLNPLVASHVATADNKRRLIDPRAGLDSLRSEYINYIRLSIP